MIDTCVIIPMYNHAEMTAKCIEATLAKAGIGVFVLVVDDGSQTPFTYEHNQVHVLRLDKNSGYTNATNQGILWCADKYKYLHLQNNDIEPQDNYISILRDAMEADHAIGIASSVRILPNHKPHNIELYGVDLIRGYQMMTNGEGVPDIIHTYWVPLCSALVRTEMLRYIGILDPQMIMWCSDNDLCIRANFANWNVSLLTKSVVTHQHNVTTGTHNEKGVQRDQQVLLQKIANLKYAELMKKLPLDAESQTYGYSEFKVGKKQEAD